MLDCDQAGSPLVEAVWHVPAWLWDKGVNTSSIRLKWLGNDNIPVRAKSEAAPIRQVSSDETEEVLAGFVDGVK